MKQRLMLSVPQLDKNGRVMRDKYSKPITTQKEFQCRTRVHGEERQSYQLRVDDARDEVDVMPFVDVQEGQEVEYTTIGGEVKKGAIKAIAETTNLTASKVYFRTLTIDG